MRDYTKLTVWRKSHRLVLDIYQITSSFPSNEIYGLSSQMRRAAVSIPSNIAEGAGRRTSIDFRRFLNIAAGSASELEYQIVLTRDLGFLSVHTAEPLVRSAGEIKKMLRTLSEKLTANS